MTEISSGPTTFEPGDIVQLKSFGPAMTVICRQGDGVHVLWYGEVNDEVKTHVIPAIALEKITVLEMRTKRTTTMRMRTKMKTTTTKGAGITARRTAATPDGRLRIACARRAARVYART